MSAAADAPSLPSSRGGRSSAAVQATFGAVSSFIDELAATIPDELAALRPEDIRVEAEFANRVVRNREPEAPVLPARVAAPPLPETRSVPAAPQTAQTAQPVQMPRRVETLPQALVRPGPPPPPGSPLPVAVGQSQPTTPMDAALSAIEIEPTSILPSGRETRTASEVVLQPVTVLAWSLLVLMAMPMAFLAGLLLGHFVWK